MKVIHGCDIIFINLVAHFIVSLSLVLALCSCPSHVQSGYKIQKQFQNVMLVGMASEISKDYTYKCVDRSRHNGMFDGFKTAWDPPMFSRCLLTFSGLFSGSSCSVKGDNC